MSAIGPRKWGMHGILLMLSGYRSNSLIFGLAMGYLWQFKYFLIGQMMICLVDVSGTLFPKPSWWTRLGLAMGSHHASFRGRNLRVFDLFDQEMLVNYGEHTQKMTSRTYRWNDFNFGCHNLTTFFFVWDSYGLVQKLGYCAPKSSEFKNDIPSQLAINGV